jgi:NADH-quinone oxidoreductase subunit N
MDAILTELIVGGVILVILLMEAALSPRRQTRSMGHFSLFGCLLALAVTLSRWGSEGGGRYGVADDSFALYCEIVLLAGAALVLLISISQSTPPRSEICALILMATLGMMIAASAADLLILFLGLELAFISLQILTASTRFSAMTGEAAIKLTIISAAASAFFIMGFAVIYGATGTADYAEMAAALSASTDHRLATIGVGLLLIALGLRLGAVPLHLWLPDVWQGAALPVIALLASGAMVAFVAALMRLLAHGLEPLQSTWIPIVSVVAVATMTVGNLLALGQRYLKRALACAGAAQVGFALCGLAAFQAGGLGAATFALTVVALFSLGIYAAVSLCSRPEDGLTEIDDYSGLGRSHPLFGIGLIALLLGLAGLPPTAGFAARLWLAEVAIENGTSALGAAVVFNTILSAYLYIRIGVRLFMVAPRGEGALAVRWNPEAVAVVTLAIIAGLAVGLWPGPIMDVARQSAQAVL